MYMVVVKADYADHAYIFEDLEEATVYAREMEKELSRYNTAVFITQILDIPIP